MIPAAAFLAAGFGAPALAQDSDAPTTNITIPAPAANSADAVGPAQLRDFSLQGTVTRRAEPATAAGPRPAPSQTATTRAPVQGGTATTQARAPVSAQRTSSARQQPAASTAAAPNTFTFQPPTPAREPAAGFTPTVPVQQPVSLPATVPLDPTDPGAGSGILSYWPWLLALLAAVGAAAWYFRRPRTGYAFAGPDVGAGTAAGFDLSPPPVPVRPATQPPRPAVGSPEQGAMPQLAPRAPGPDRPVVSGGVVSTRLRAAPEARDLAPPPPPAPTPASPGLVSSRLRPWLELEFTPLSALVERDQAVIEFQLSLFNSGSAPAREALVEARLFNAGDDQDEAIAAFFANRVATGDAIPLVAPLERMDFRTTASVSRNQMRIFEAGGRQVFVPLIGFNAIYRWSNGQGQTSVSYVLGRNNASGDKMAPFIIGDEARTFRSLGAREHTVRVRK